MAACLATSSNLMSSRVVLTDSAVCPLALPAQCLDVGIGDRGLGGDQAPDVELMQALQRRWLISSCADIRLRGKP